MSIKLATYDGSLRDPKVALITAFSLGNRGVHTELWIDNYRVSTFRPKKCIEVIPFNDEEQDIKHRLTSQSPIADVSGWHIINVPITDNNKVLQFIEEAVACPADYSVCIPEFAMPKSMLDYLDHDLDCCHPEKWDKLFCSQFALLFLRRCAVAGILDVPLAKQKLLWSVNSKGCLPSRLQIIADQIFNTQ